MSRVTVSLLVLVVALLGAPFGATGAPEPERNREIATAMRALLAEVEAGSLSEDELASLLLAELAAAVGSPKGGNYESPPDDAVPGSSDEATERRLQLSSASMATNAIMIGNAPVAILSEPLVIPAGAFTDDGFDPDSSFFSFGGYLTGKPAAYGCMVAPAALPRGVTVTALFATVLDNDASFNLGIALRRVNNFTGVGGTMATASSSGSSASVRTISVSSINDPTVSYPDYTYYVTTCLSSDQLRLYSVRIYFTP